MSPAPTLSCMRRGAPPAMSRALTMASAVRSGVVTFRPTRHLRTLPVLSALPCVQTSRRAAGTALSGGRVSRHKGLTSSWPRRIELLEADPSGLSSFPTESEVRDGRSGVAGHRGWLLDVEGRDAMQLPAVLP